jgi:peptide/nickel transport system permease protein
VAGLEVDVEVSGRRVKAVRGANLQVRSGEVVALIGESGSGKTLTLRAALGLLPPGCRVAGGRVDWRGANLLDASEQRWRQVRRSELIYIPADSSSLNPVFRIDAQLAEAIEDGTRPGAGRRLAPRIQRSLAAVGLGRSPRESAAIARRYPHQLSGGMRQRALISMGVERHGAIVVADEPTSGLDMTTQRQVIRMLGQFRDDTGLGILITSHDLDLVGDIADRVVVMYAGQVVEDGTRDEVFGNPAHPYTLSLLRCIPSRVQHGDYLMTIEGAPPRLDEMPAGCAFRDRCPRYQELGQPAECLASPPLAPAQHDSDRAARCFFPVTGPAEPPGGETAADTVVTPPTAAKETP